MPHEKPDERIPTELPLAEYVYWARQQNDELYEPPSSGTVFRSPMWEFVRLCKAHPALRGKSALDAFRQIDGIRLRDRERGFPWEDLFDSDDPQAEFVATWDKIRIPAGEDILALAIALAKAKPLKPRISISQGYSRYVSVAFRLQQLRPGDYIRLPVERLANALQVDPRTISNYAQLAQANGLLTRIAKAHKPSAQAAKYTFRIELFNVQTGEQLSPADDHHFHKEHKESKDIEESKESDEHEMTRRASEEAERFGGEAGREIDKDGSGGNFGALRAQKNNATPPAGRREELKRQAQFLEARMKRK